MIRYLRSCFKKTAYHLPAFLIGSVLILLLTGAALHVYLGRTIGASPIDIRVGIVASPDEPMIDWILDILKNNKSTAASCEFTLMSEGDANAALRSDEILAAFIIPENYIHSLIVGENTPVIIRYHKDSVNIAGFLIRQLTEAASSYIISTEAAIYSMQDYYAIHGVEPLMDDANALNLVFLDEVIQRDRMIKTSSSYSALDLPLATYYTLAFLVLWMFMSGLCAYKMADSFPASLMRRISRSLPLPLQTLLRYIAFATFFCGVYLITVPFSSMYLSMISHTFWSESVLMMVRYLPAVLCAASVIFAIYTIFDKENVAIMFLAFFTIACGFVCGCFYPMQYLPESFDVVSRVLPMRAMMEYMGSVSMKVEVGSPMLYLGKMIVMMVIVLGIAMIADTSRSNR